MEGDQVASLFVRMAADGRIDFSKANLLDRQWKLRLLWLCGAYRAKKESDILRLHLFRCTGALATDNNDLFKKMWQNSDDIVSSILELELPWLDRDRKPRKQYDEYRELLEAYKEIIGDWDDPEFRKQVELEIEQARRKRLGLDKD